MHTKIGPLTELFGDSLGTAGGVLETSVPNWLGVGGMMLKEAKRYRDTIILL
jgi:hypothetical protein